MGIRSLYQNYKSYKAWRDGNPLENPSVAWNSPAVWAWLNFGNPTESGELVNEVSALQTITVYACVRVLAESIASLPLKVYERLTKGRAEAITTPLYNLLACEPNPEMTAFTFFETLAGCLALTGNCYAEIVRNGSGQVLALYPLHPLGTEPFRMPDGKTLAYKTHDSNGSDTSKWRVIKSEDMLHVPLFCMDGLKGMSPIAQARQSIGLTRAAEKFGARFFGNGSRPGGVLATESKLDPKQIQEIRESWQAMQGGVNQGKTAFLPGAWTYHQIGLSPEDSQFLATRKFQREDIAALFRVPAHMVGDNTKLSNANAVQTNLSFVIDTLRPYLCKFEQEFHRKLLPDIGRNANRFFVQFDVRERLRGDFKTEAEGFALGRQWGFLTTNMILEQLGENPVGEEGDILWAPVNMTNAKNLLPGEQPPAPQQSEEPTEAESKALAHYTTAFLMLARDAVGRAIKRDKRDLDTLSTIFTPLLAGLSEQFTDVAIQKFGLDDSWKPATDKLIREHLKGMEKRAADWTAEKADEVTGQELQKVVRALFIQIHKDAGAAVAVRGLSDE
jgi:HK97 family phage portal protein